MFQVNSVSLQRTKVLAQRARYSILQRAVTGPFDFGLLYFDQDFRPSIASPIDYGNGSWEVSTNIQAKVTHQTASFTRLLPYSGRIT